MTAREVARRNRDRFNAFADDFAARAEAETVHPGHAAFLRREAIEWRQLAWAMQAAMNQEASHV